MEQSVLHRRIAIVAAVAFFLFFFAGAIFFPFPRLYVLELFGVSVKHSQQSTSGIADAFNQGGSSVFTADRRQMEERLDGLVSFFEVKEGSGARADISSVVSVGYVGTFIDDDGEEVEFDRNTDSNNPFTFTLGTGSVIPGFEQGIIGMREGGMRLIVIEPEAGYGDRQAGTIPPDTTLRFLVELYEVGG